MNLRRLPRTLFAVVFGFGILALPGLAETPKDLVKKCGPAVVAFRDKSGEVFGSGVLVSADGTVLTAEHLFEDGEEFTVTLPSGETMPVKRFLYRDAALDLAALEVVGQKLPFVTLGNPEQVEIGEAVVAIGNPGGLENTVSLGIISGKRELTEDKFRFQTTAPISPGSSGGGLFDERGRLLGITVSFMTGGQNLNFAVPVHYADLQTLKSLDSGVTQAPGDLKPLLDRARAYFEVQEFELALVDLRQALQLDAANAEAHRIRGEIFYRQERYPESLTEFSEVVELAPDDAQAYLDRGYTLYGMERYEEALEDLERAVKLDPDYEIAHSGRAFVLQVLGRHADAAEAWREALRIDPEDTSYLTARAMCYYLADDNDAAKADAMECLSLDPQNCDANELLGRILILEQDFDGATKALDQAVAADPGAGSHYYHRARASYLGEQYEKALTDLDQALQLEYDDAQVRNLRGEVFYQFGRYDRATQEYSKALEFEPERADILYSRACAYTVLGSKGPAIADFEEVLRLDPSFEYAAEVREELAKLKKP
jgi:tetratricopeptide (TPR) repeat protein